MRRKQVGTAERGETNITLDNLETIADGLGLTVLALFRESAKEGR